MVQSRSFNHWLIVIYNNFLRGDVIAERMYSQRYECNCHAVWTNRICRVTVSLSATIKQHRRNHVCISLTVVLGINRQEAACLTVKLFLVSIRRCVYVSWIVSIEWVSQSVSWSLHDSPECLRVLPTLYCDNLFMHFKQKCVIYRIYIVFTFHWYIVRLLWTRVQQVMRVRVTVNGAHWVLTTLCSGDRFLLSIVVCNLWRQNAVNGWEMRNIHTTPKKKALEL